MHTLSEKEIRHSIFNYLNPSDFLTLRTVNKDWSKLIWEYLFSSNTPHAQAYQLHYHAELLTTSNEKFKQFYYNNNYPLYRLNMKQSSMNLFYDMLVKQRISDKTFYVSDRQVTQLLKNIGTVENDSTLRLVGSIGWALSKEQFTKVQQQINRLITKNLELIYAGKCSTNHLEKVVFLKKQLTTTQIFAITDILTQENTARKFLYKEHQINLLYNELPSGKINHIIQKILNAMSSSDKMVKQNMLLLFKCSMHRANQIQPMFVLTQLERCVSDDKFEIIKLALSILHLYAQTLNDKEHLLFLLKIAKPHWNHSEREIRNLAIQLFVNHEQGFNYSEVMQFWRNQSLGNQDKFNPFINKLNVLELELFTEQFLEQFIQEVQNVSFSSLTMDVFEHLVTKFNPQQWSRLTILMEDGIKSQNIDQQIIVLYMLKISVNHMNEMFEIFVPEIIRLAKTNQTELTHPILEILEKIPELINVDFGNVFLDFILRTLINQNPFTCNQAMVSLMAVEKKLILPQKRRVIDCIKICLNSDFGQALITFKTYAECLDIEVRSKVIAEILNLLDEEQNSFERLEILHTLLKILDPIHLKEALAMIQLNLQENQLNLKSKSYSLNMFFSFAHEYEEKIWSATVDITDVVQCLQLFLKHNNENYRKSAMEKIITLLNSKIFSPEVKRYCAQYFFGNTNSFVESVYVNIAAQPHLWNKSEEDMANLFDTHSQHYLKKKRYYLNKSSFHAPEACTLHTLEACNLLYQILHTMDPQNTNPEARIAFIQKIEKYPVFSSVYSSLVKLKEKIKACEIDLWQFDLMEIDVASDNQEDELILQEFVFL